MPRKALDLVGMRFGRLVVNSRAENRSRHPAWNCVCDCGNEVVCLGLNLKRGTTKSCGCLHRDITTKHGHCKNGKTSKIYGVWSAMIDRCEKKNNKYYSYYGERGIRVYEKWHTFEGFFEDMGPTYEEGLTLDRIDVNGNYEPSNCRWVTMGIQAKNRRINKLNKTGVSGVSITKQGTYRAKIKVNRTNIELGIFTTLEEATQARKTAEQKFWTP